MTPLPGEGLAATRDRSARIATIEREMSTVARKIRNEKQLNRQMELRRRVKELEAELATLGKCHQ